MGYYELPCFPPIDWLHLERPQRALEKDEGVIARFSGRYTSGHL